MRPVISALLPLLLCFSRANAAHAEEWTFDLDQQKLDALGIDRDELTKSLGEQFAKELRSNQQPEFLQQMAAAAVLASKGMGVDYASNPQRFVVGGGLGTATSQSGFSFARGDGMLPDGGFAFQISALAGLNLGAFGSDSSALRRVMLYGNGLTIKTSNGLFDARTWCLAGHLQVKLVRPTDRKGAVTWGGLDLTSGFEWASSSLWLSRDLDLEVDDLEWAATGTYQVDTQAMSVPIELSTNLHLAVVSLFAGGALDVTHAAEAHSTAGLNGPLKTSGDSPQQLGTITMVMDETGEAGGLSGRAFGGLQIDIFTLKLYGHLNVGFDQTMGGHVGVRMAL